MSIEPIFGISLLLLSSYLGGEIARRVRAPRIVGNIFAGLLIGPSVLGIITHESLQAFGYFNTLALGVVAFTIGGELQFSKIWALGKSIAATSFFEAFGAVALVAVAMILLGQPLALALILGAIASATAPAGTLAVLQEYKARGPVTNTLLAVVALDDAYAIIIAGIVLAFVPALLTNSAISLQTALLLPGKEILGSIALGAIVGLILHLVASRLIVTSRRREATGDLLLTILGVTLLTSAVAVEVEMSPLLTNMALGCTIANLSPLRQQMVESITAVELLVYSIFFALAGASIHLELLLQLGLIGAAYVVARGLGKWVGAGLGARLANAEPAVQRFLGLGLLSQAGVAIGLVIEVQHGFPQLGTTVGTLIFAAVAVNELIGPFATKAAITWAKEARFEEGVPGQAELPPFDPMRVITVEEAMTKDFPTIPVTMPVTELARIFEESGHHGFPVVDEQGRLYGVVSITDVAQASVEGDMDLTVADIATTSLITAYPDQTLHEALRQWGAQDVSRLLVIDRENPRQLRGVLRRHDVVSAYGKASRQWSEVQAHSQLASLASDGETRLAEIDLAAGSTLIGRAIKELRLPEECILVSIKRGGQIVIPHGDTILQQGDKVTVYCTAKAEAEVRKALI